MGIVVVSLPVTAVQMWIIAFKFVRASKVVHKVLGLGTAKNNATQNEVFDKCEFHPHGVRVCYTMFWILLILLKLLLTYALFLPDVQGGGGRHSGHTLSNLTRPRRGHSITPPSPLRPRPSLVAVAPVLMEGPKMWGDRGIQRKYFLLVPSETQGGGGALAPWPPSSTVPKPRSRCWRRRRRVGGYVTSRIVSCDMYFTLVFTMELKSF